MDKRPTIFTIISQIFFIFGVTVTLLNIFCILFGSVAEEFSTIFSLGSSGISCETLFQFLIMSTLCVLLRYFFMSDNIIKKMSLTARCVCMFSGILIICIAMITIFGWFPVTNVLAWVMFIICFVVSCTISTVLSNISEKQENQKLAEALQKAKEEL